jgi:hypothetical protein
LIFYVTESEEQMPPQLVTFTQGEDTTDLTIHLGTDEFEIQVEAGEDGIVVTLSSNKVYDTAEEMLGFKEYYECVVCQGKFSPIWGGLFLTNIHRWGVPAPNVWVCNDDYQWLLKLEQTNE